jgi:hypothetical protein
MSKIPDPLKIEKYKQARLKGASKARALLEAGYKKTTAYHKASQTEVVKSCEPELIKEMKASEITVEWVVNQLLKELVAPDAKASDRIRVAELLGKYLNMFKEAQHTTQIAIFQDVTKDLPKIIEPVEQIEAPLETPQLPSQLRADNANSSNSTS